jgi:thiamine biosynthesis lipoprotein
MNLRLFILPLLLFISSCSNPIEETLYSISGKTMGTTFSIKFTSQNILNSEEIEEEINEVLRTVNRQMSTYIPSSELSLFNQSKDTNWISVSSDLASVCDEALKISKISKGKFDITVGPLVNLWGFGPNNIPQKIPTIKEIAERREFIGYKNVHVQLLPSAIKKSQPNIYCDLSAIAKGFGVDKVSEYLLKKGITNHLVEIGGELRASGNKFGNNWKVGISRPNQSRTIQEIIELNNLAMATSGDYWNYFEEDGVRYSHTIDPTTGRPISHKLASVTVIAESCMKADGLATAIDVMGPVLGLKFSNENELSAYFIVKEENDFKIFYTSQFFDLFMKGK